MATQGIENFNWTPADERQVAKFTNWATEYFAYVALIGCASAAAVVALVFSANIAFQYLDTISKPGYFDPPTQASTPAPVPVEAQRVRGKAFAMLPASVPLNIRNDVIASQF